MRTSSITDGSRSTNTALGTCLPVPVSGIQKLNQYGMKLRHSNFCKTNRNEVFCYGKQTKLTRLGRMWRMSRLRCPCRRPRASTRRGRRRAPGSTAPSRRCRSGNQLAQCGLRCTHAERKMFYKKKDDEKYPLQSSGVGLPF